MYLVFYFLHLAFPLIGRDRRQSESRVSEIARDPRFSVLYRPRSCDSLIAENKERLYFI